MNSRLEKFTGFEPEFPSRFIWEAGASVLVLTKSSVTGRIVGVKRATVSKRTGAGYITLKRVEGGPTVTSSKFGPVTDEAAAGVFSHQPKSAGLGSFVSVIVPDTPFNKAKFGLEVIEDAKW